MGALSNVLVSLAKGLGGLVKQQVKFQSLRKEDVQLFIQNSIEAHQKMEYILGLLPDAEMKRWLRDVVTPAMKNDSSIANNIYNNYVTPLNGKAASDERQRPLLSLKECHHDYQKLLKEISKKLDSLFENQATDLWNVRMSHLAVMGMLRQSDMVVNFSNYMYTYMSRLASKTANSIPKYRANYLVDNCDRVAKIVTDFRSKKGNYLFLQEVDTMKKQQRDLVLGATGDITGFLKHTSISHFSVSILDSLASALSCLNIFGAAMDAWDDYKLDKYERNKETKEWLEQHVSLLRMDLEGMDPSSPQYTKTLQIIQAYDDKIADYDRRILEFEQEEV